MRLQKKKDSKPSKIWFGGYLLPSTSKIVWMDLVSKSHWEVRLSNVKVRGQNIHIKATTSAVLDSGTSLNYLPMSDYDNVLNVIKKGKKCYFNK